MVRARGGGESDEELEREGRNAIYFNKGGRGVERLIAKITADTRNRLGVRLSEHCLPWIQPGGMYVPVDTRDIIYGDSYRPRRRILPPT